MKKIFSTGYLKSKGLPYNAVEKRLCPSSGWTIKYEIIFEDAGKFWKAPYEYRTTAESGFLALGIMKKVLNVKNYLNL